ncbi:MAG: tRNA preQ1(34) S-adenosylmethionine ribosyltransferase-isomerase QueA [SAR202 cluster bacterium]|nr:tRNA preQ1(34) S-adenosylmethionine ribosyltransferase-isomerase QueA [SAR202 cluster bacterium]|tara:strand:+ start:47097 stop:48125 length:1029 start_codon:yes stop_codon:yes gene_type:complete
MLTSDFDYNLPQELIAQHPISIRDTSKLMVLNKISGEIQHSTFHEITKFLKKNDLLVFNDTKVLQAKIKGYSPNIKKNLEILLTEKIDSKNWKCLIKNSKKIPDNSNIKINLDTKKISVDIKIKQTLSDGSRIIQFFEDIDLNTIGVVPLPPYIKTNIKNSQRYQTIYAKHDGSIAAPTAGLHFTEEILKKINSIGVNFAFVTLHIGIGTFRPIYSKDPLKHKMHPERWQINQLAADKINTAKQNGHRIIAVGTTTTRLLENSIDQIGKPLNPGNGLAKNFILPGYNFKVVDGLITNFHLPKSTLLMMVSAMAGKENIFSAYQNAIKNNYRFYSFGDSMLIT